MRMGKGPCNWYTQAKSAALKPASKWLRRGAVESYIQKHYDNFEQTILDFKKPPPPSGNRRVDALMKEFYLQPNSALHDELDRRRHEHGLRECPFCGNPLIPDTLDHFLPKEHWPEYSIYANNLVPQCRSCAPIKGQKYYCNTSLSALFLHPMYSALLASVRFKIDVAMMSGTPQFTIEFSVEQGLTKVDIERVSLHLSKLRVPKRMLEFSMRHWSHWKRIVESNGIDIEALFQAEIGPNSTSPYGRDWATAFKKGVLRNRAALAAMSSKLPLRLEPAETVVMIKVV